MRKTRRGQVAMSYGELGQYGSLKFQLGERYGEGEGGGEDGSGLVDSLEGGGDQMSIGTFEPRGGRGKLAMTPGRDFGGKRRKKMALGMEDGDSDEDDGLMRPVMSKTPKTARSGRSVKSKKSFFDDLMEEYKEHNSFLEQKTKEDGLLLLEGSTQKMKGRILIN